MGERDTLPPGPNKGSLTFEETSALWQMYQEGKATSCPRDSGPLALSVDGGNFYRFVCTKCGTATIWFEANASGVHFRTMPPPPVSEEA